MEIKLLIRLTLGWTGDRFEGLIVVMNYYGKQDTRMVIGDSQ